MDANAVKPDQQLSGATSCSVQLVVVVMSKHAHTLTESHEMIEPLASAPMTHSRGAAALNAVRSASRAKEGRPVEHYDCKRK